MEQTLKFGSLKITFATENDKDRKGQGLISQEATSKLWGKQLPEARI
jgi:hypothetical protein